MALQKDTTFRGIQILRAYIRVTGPQISRDKVGISFEVQFHADPGAPVFEATTMVAPYSLDGDNPIAQAYAHLKSLPEYADAIDC